MIRFANKLAPEHLEIITKKPQQLANKIKSAGLVLIGKNTPSSASDYLLGSNHILPTNGFGRTQRLIRSIRLHENTNSSRII